MISADTSTMVAYFEGKSGRDIDILHEIIKNNSLYLPPIVIAELTSDPALPENILKTIIKISTLPIKENYWIRTGQTRSIILSKKLKARMSDALIAQSCIDNDAALLTRDSDFRHFAQYCGLKLI